MAAGMGSRYGGVKQIDAVGMHGETLLDFGVRDALDNGFGRVVFIIRPDIEKDFRERLFDRIARNMEASYVFQTLDSLLTPEQQKKAAEAGRKKPWGTIHAVLCAKDAVKEPFAVINADDYYGRDAYRTMGKYLSTVPVDGTDHAMVGYVLKNTMSLNGTVTRAICEVDGDYLKTMRENPKIGYTPDGRIETLVDGVGQPLTGDEWVSMNFFGFTPRAFASFQSYWDAFIAENVTTEKTECYLPEGSAHMVRNGEGRIRFFTTQEKWFGMTYSEDRQMVRDQLARKIAEGYYPEKLWEK